MKVGRFPQNFIEDLKEHADIVRVVQDTVPLKKTGNSYKGLCPFHAEKTPSFHVNQEKGFFHCFGCGIGGDVVKFVELNEKLNFSDSVLLLAERLGLQVPDLNETKEERVATAQREALLKAHELAATFFQEQLNTPNGKRATQYLAKRGIFADTISRLGIGFAPAKRDSLTKHLLNEGQSLDLLLTSGLVIQRDNKTVLDRFRNRLMIPICRDTGSVIAFGGRALENGQQPKYLNSPETPLYTKRRTLYGLHLSKSDIKRLGYSVMVEGYFDFAQAIQAGVNTVVATCGTAVTRQQARLLRRFASKVIISFDPDTAGQAATTRSGELLLAEQLQVNVTRLPPGEDPDTYIQQHGKQKYIEQLKESKPYLEHVLDRASLKHDLSNDGQRRMFLNEMLNIAASIPDAATRDKFGDRVAHKARIMEDVIRAEIRNAAVSKRTRLDDSTAKSIGKTITTAEKGLIWSIMQDTKTAQDVLVNTETADFVGLATETILKTALTLAEWPANNVSETLLERLNSTEIALTKQIGLLDESPASARDCAVELRRLRYERERAELQNQIDQKQQLGTPDALEEIEALWQQKKDLLQRIEALGV